MKNIARISAFLVAITVVGGATYFATTPPSVTVQGNITALQQSLASLQVTANAIAVSTAAAPAEVAARIGADAALSNATANLADAGTALSADVTDLTGADTALSTEVWGVSAEIYAPTASVVPDNPDADIGSLEHPWRHGYFTSHSLKIGSTTISETEPGKISALGGAATNSDNLFRNPEFNGSEPWRAAGYWGDLPILTNSTAVNTNVGAHPLLIAQNYALSEGTYTVSVDIVQYGAQVEFGIQYQNGSYGPVVTWTSGGQKEYAMTVPVTWVTSVYFSIGGETAISNPALRRAGFSIVVTNETATTNTYITEESDPLWEADKTNYPSAADVVEFTVPTAMTFESDPAGVVTNAIVVSGARDTLPGRPVVGQVVYTPRGGAYTDQVDVVLSSATEGVAIYYTDDGSVPTTNGLSTTNTGVVTFTDPATNILRAFASLPSYAPSHVTDSRVFTVVPAAVIPPGGGPNTNTLIVSGAAVSYANGTYTWVDPLVYPPWYGEPGVTAGYEAVIDGHNMIVWYQSSSSKWMLDESAVAGLYQSVPGDILDWGASLTAAYGP